MFKWMLRKRLDQALNTVRSFFEQNPYRKPQLASVFIREFEVFSENVGIDENVERKEYFQTHLTSLHQKADRVKFEKLYYQIRIEGERLKEQHGPNIETVAYDLLSGLALSMALTQPAQGETQLDAMHKGKFSKYYQSFSTYAEELFTLNLENN